MKVFSHGWFQQILGLKKGCPQQMLEPSEVFSHGQFQQRLVHDQVFS